MRRKKNKANKSVNLQVLPVVNPNAAGIDVGAKEHVVAVPCDRDPQPVRTFQAFTPDPHELAAWLKRCGIETVALESTGIYWISLYEVLEQYGFEIRVVNARHVKHVPGRTKTDVLDCQWIQKLHSFGLLNGSFRPDQQIRKLRTYMRLRDNLVVASTQAVHHMQKALFEMNVQLSNVISDIVGETGLNILEAIIAGQRDPKQLAALCGSRIKASRETVAKSLHGNWDDALLFALKTALEAYRFNQTKIQESDCCIQQHLAQFESRAQLTNSPQNLKAQLHRVCGVDLTKIPGIREQSAQIIISEVGLDMTQWKTEKQFCSFLGLCPNNSISGGKVLHRAKKKPNHSIFNSFPPSHFHHQFLERDSAKTSDSLEHKLYKVGSLIFAYGREQRALVLSPFDDIDRPEVAYTVPEILEPAKFKQLLATAEEEVPELIPFLAMAGFAGLRRSELVREYAEDQVLRWEDINWQKQLITVRHEVAKQTSRKMGNRRFIPMEAALLHWFSPYRKEEGLLIPMVDSAVRRRMKKLRLASKVNPPTNALRHSYASYWLARSSKEGLGELSKRMGNSFFSYFRISHEMAARAA